MDNVTWDLDVLLLEGLIVAPGYTLPVFAALLLTYVSILVVNTGLILLIVSERRLRQPMYLFFCNLMMTDVFNSTATVPHTLLDLSKAATQRKISFVFCALQAFCVNFSGSTVHTILMVMAFDRYVAICNPLRYPSIMNTHMVVKLSLAAWGSTFFMVSILLGLTLRLSRCRRVIQNQFCDNASLFKLSCEDLTVNNIFGLAYTVLLLGSSLLVMVLTYFKIACVCIRSRSMALNRKALHTCASHLTMYLYLLLASFGLVALHRYPQFSQHRKVMAAVGGVLQPVLNTLIFGLQIREIRSRVQALCCRRKQV